jgi:hypothetical protein
LRSRNSRCFNRVRTGSITIPSLSKNNGQGKDTERGIEFIFTGQRPMGRHRTRWFSQVLEEIRREE